MKNKKNENDGTDPKKASGVLAVASLAAVGTAVVVSSLPLLLIGIGSLLFSGMINPGNGEDGPDSHGG